MPLLLVLIVLATAEPAPALEPLSCPQGTSNASGRVYIWLSTFQADWCARPNGVRHGPFRGLWPNGRAYTQGECREGKREGRWTNFWSDGTVGYIREMHEGVRIATSTVFDHQGTRLEEVIVEPSGGRRIQTFASDGSVKKDCRRAAGANKEDCERRGMDGFLWKEHSENGRIEGRVAAHDDSGTLREQGLYRHGAREGEWKRFRVDGKPFESGRYHQGEREGAWQQWDESGQVKVVKYRHGAAEGSRPESPDQRIKALLARTHRGEEPLRGDFSQEAFQVQERSVLGALGGTPPPSLGPCGNPASQ